MTNNSKTDCVRSHTVRVWLGVWVFISAALWTTFALMPTGAIAVGDAGHVVSVAPATVTTSKGIFVIEAKSVSLPRGAAVQIERINNAFSDLGLRLCAMPESVGGATDHCADLKGEYFGTMSPTPLAKRAWSGGTMTTLALLAMFVTGIGWVPGAFLSTRRDCDAEAGGDEEGAGG